MPDNDRAAKAYEEAAGMVPVSPKRKGLLIPQGVNGGGPSSSFGGPTKYGTVGKDVGLPSTNYEELPYPLGGPPPPMSGRSTPDPEEEKKPGRKSKKGQEA